MKDCCGRQPLKLLAAKSWSAAAAPGDDEEEEEVVVEADVGPNEMSGVVTGGQMNGCAFVFVPAALAKSP